LGDKQRRAGVAEIVRAKVAQVADLEPIAWAGEVPDD
jgi:hypothetical protein